MKERHLATELRSRFSKLLCSGNYGPSGGGNLQSETEFYEAMHRERSRADRTGLPLSLMIMWELDNNDADTLPPREPMLLTSLARLLVDRVRCTDVVGRYEAAKLGVLLPHTTAEAAWTILQDVHSDLVRMYGSDDVLRKIFYRVHTTDMNGEFLDDGFSPVAGNLTDQDPTVKQV